MTETEARDSIQGIVKELYILSEEVAQGLEKDGLDNQYLSNKLQEVINTASHIQGQLKHKR